MAHPASTAVSSAAPAPLPRHALGIDEVVASLESSPQGLSSTEAARRLEQYGPNLLPRGKRDGPLTLLWRQIHNPLIWVLIASGAVAMVVDWEGEGPKNGIVILAVVLINSVIGFVQEYRAAEPSKRSAKACRRT